MLFWLIIVSRYNLRPKYFVFNKNDDYLRDNNSDVRNEETDKAKVPPKKAMESQTAKVSVADAVFLERIISNPAANLHFKTNKKGELSVHIKEVK